MVTLIVTRWHFDSKTEKIPSPSPGRDTLTNKWARTEVLNG